MRPIDRLPVFTVSIFSAICQCFAQIESIKEQRNMLFISSAGTNNSPFPVFVRQFVCAGFKFNLILDMFFIFFFHSCFPMCVHVMRFVADAFPSSKKRRLFSSPLRQKVCSVLFGVTPSWMTSPLVFGLNRSEIKKNYSNFRGKKY